MGGRDEQGAKRESLVKEEHVREVFENGRWWLRTKEAKQANMKLTGAERSAACDALKVGGGRFSHLVEMKNGLPGLRPGAVSKDEAEKGEAL